MAQHTLNVGLKLRRESGLTVDDQFIAQPTFKADFSRLRRVDIQTQSLSRQDLPQKLHATNAHDRVGRQPRSQFREDIIEQHHAGHERMTREMPGQRWMRRIDGELHKICTADFFVRQPILSRYNKCMNPEAATLKAPLDQATIRRLIPHAGAMCLLDRVVSWNDAEIECAAVSHRAGDNPLRHDDALPIHAGIEYCAQAIAVHGQLTGKNSGPPRRGYIAVVMNTDWRAQRLDNIEGELRVFAKKQVVLQQGVTYAFAIRHEGHTLLTGQTVVALE